VNLDDAKKIFENGWNKLANMTKTTANDFSKMMAEKKVSEKITDLSKNVEDVSKRGWDAVTTFFAKTKSQLEMNLKPEGSRNEDNIKSPHKNMTMEGNVESRSESVTEITKPKGDDDLINDTVLRDPWAWNAANDFDDFSNKASERSSTNKKNDDTFGFGTVDDLDYDNNSKNDYPTKLYKVKSVNRATDSPTQSQITTKSKLLEEAAIAAEKQEDSTNENGWNDGWDNFDVDDKREGTENRNTKQEDEWENSNDNVGEERPTKTTAKMNDGGVKNIKSPKSSTTENNFKKSKNS